MPQSPHTLPASVPTQRETSGPAVIHPVRVVPKPPATGTDGRPGRAKTSPGLSPILLGIGALLALSGVLFLIAALDRDVRRDPVIRNPDDVTVFQGESRFVTKETIQLVADLPETRAPLEHDGLVAETDGSLAIPVQAGLASMVHFPGGRSKVVAVGGLDRTIEIWDVRSHRRIGTLPSDPKFAANFLLALALDGSRFAGYWEGEVFVREVATGSEVRLPVGGPDVLADRIEFGADSTRMWVLVREDESGLRTVVQVWDTVAGSQVSEVVIPEPVNPDSVAVDSDHERLAFTGTDHLWVIRPADGKILIRLPLTGEAGAPVNVNCLALAFSPDGRELAGVFRSGLTAARLVTFDLASPALPTRIHALPGPVIRELGRDWLQYMPDGRALLIGHERVVARDTGATLATVGGMRKMPGHGPRRVLSDGTVLEFRDEGGPARLAGFRIDGKL